MFRHVNGQVKIGGFRCSAAEFAAVEPAFTGLPNGIIERRYDPHAPAGKPGHVLITADHRQTGGPVPWPEGDVMLAKSNEYPFLHEAAFPPPHPSAQPAPRAKAVAPLEPTGTTVVALRAELAALREALIDTGVLKV